MSDCKFVRKNKTKYEYGHIKIHDIGMKSERRECIVLGEVDSYEAALELNAMALQGMAKVKQHVAPTYWD